MKKYFYRADDYVTSLDGLQTSCILRGDTVALAYKINEKTHALA